MENEKDLLNKDLAGLEKKEDIEKFIDDAELLGGHEEIVALAKEKITALESAAEPSVVKENEKGEMEYLGGNTADLDEKLQPGNAAISEVKAEAEKEITAVSEEGDVDALEVQEKVDLEKLKAELQENKDASYEVQDKMSALDNGIKAMYDELKDLEQTQTPSERIYAELFPSKIGAQRNLEKIMTAATNESDKQKISALIVKIESMSDDEIKKAAANLETAKIMDISTGTFTRMNSITDKDLGRITGDLHVENAVQAVEAGMKKVTEFKEKIENDPLVTQAREQILLLDKQNQEYIKEIKAIEEKINANA